jgi:HAD superfamily hydrolase (TIGR01549 family)
MIRWRLCLPFLVSLMSFLLKETLASFVRGTRTRAFGTRNERSSVGALMQQQSPSVTTTRLFSCLPWSDSPPAGIIFDMDGTLTKPCIDFADMRRRIYQVASHDFQRNVTEGCVIELASSLSPAGQERAKEIFDEIESQAIQDMTFMDGMEELCHFLDSQGIRRAVLTRNVERSVAYLHAKMKSHPPFDPAIARDTISWDGNVIPAKPQPHAIEFICREWGCSVADVVVVGDSAKDDIVAANRAGCSSVLLQAYDKDNCSGNINASHPDERTPTVTVSSLRELHEMLRQATASSETMLFNATRQSNKHM